MIDAANKDHIERSEEYAPKRLARIDVKAFRQLYAECYAAIEACRQDGFKRRVVIYLERDKTRRGLGRLGKQRPRCVIEAAWTQERKGGEWGLNVTVHAVAIGGRAWGGNIQQQEGTQRLRIGRHRFRSSCTRTQFCREVSHLVRLGLGWSKRWSSR